MDTATWRTCFLWRYYAVKSGPKRQARSTQDSSARSCASFNSLCQLSCQSGTKICHISVRSQDHSFFSKNRKSQHLKYNNTNSQYGSQISRTYLNNSAVGEHLCETRPYVPRPTCRAVNPIEMFSKLLNRPQTSNHQFS